MATPISNRGIEALLDVGREYPTNTVALGNTSRTFSADETPGASWLYETKGAKRRTRFMAAAATGNTARLRYMLQYFAKSPESKRRILEMRDMDGFTALIYAIKNNHLESVHVLIQNAANVNHPNVLFEEDEDQAIRLTPLFYAIRAGNPAIVDALIRAGAVVNEDLINGLTALHVVCLVEGHEYLDIARLLLDNGAEVNARDRVNNNRTPLYYAIENKHRNIIQLLIARGADMNNVSDSHTGLMAAIVYDNNEVIDILIHAGANINAKGLVGYTPLHFASRENNLEAVQQLLAAGANRTILNDAGQTALDLAKTAAMRALLSDAAGGRRKTRRRKVRKSNTRRHTKS
jgi:hypothetical protein